VYTLGFPALLSPLLFAWASVVKVTSIVETFLVLPIIKLHQNNLHFLAVAFLVIR